MTSGQLQVENRAAMPPVSGATVSPDDEYTEVAHLCRQLRETMDDEQRERLRCRIITTSLPLAEHIAYRFVGRGESAEDLIQVARIGLIKAIDRYDPGRGPFLAFVVPTIMGDVRRHFRDNAWGMHVPRKLKDTHRRVSVTAERLAQQLGRAPTASEVGAELDMNREEVVRSADTAKAYRPVSLDSAMPGSGNAEWSAPGRHGAEDPRYNSVEEALTVADLVGRLTERERVIVKLRFWDDLTQTQIATHLGVSQVQVSRLLAATLKRLRRYFWEDTPSRRGALIAVCCLAVV